MATSGTYYGSISSSFAREWPPAKLICKQHVSIWLYLPIAARGTHYGSIWSSSYVTKTLHLLINVSAVRLCFFFFFFNPLPVAARGTHCGAILTSFLANLTCQQHAPVWVSAGGSMWNTLRTVLFSFPISPDIIPSGWLGSKHQPTNSHFIWERPSNQSAFQHNAPVLFSSSP